MRLAVLQPDIPQNLGAALRLCACFSAELHIIEPCGFPLSDKALRRAAMDYAALVTTVRHDDWSRFRESAGSARIILLTTKGSGSYLDYAFEASDILLLGSESTGAPEHVHASVDARLRIPMRAGVRSMNIVTAGAVVLAEALRQTGGFAYLEGSTKA